MSSELIKKLFGSEFDDTENCKKTEESVDETPVKRKRGRPRKFIKQTPKDEEVTPKVELPKMDIRCYNKVKVNILDFIPNVIDGIGIQIEESMGAQKLVIILPMDVGKIRYQEWKNNRGGLLVTDVKNGLGVYNRPIAGDYFLYHGEETDEYFIAREIETSRLPETCKQYVIYDGAGPEGFSLLFFMFIDPEMWKQRVYASRCIGDGFEFNRVMIEESEDEEDADQYSEDDNSENEVEEWDI